jgi:hypothetical protein
VTHDARFVGSNLVGRDFALGHLDGRPQTWAAFVVVGSNTYDITAVGPGGAEGTGSRLYA